MISHANLGAKMTSEIVRVYKAFFGSARKPVVAYFDDPKRVLRIAREIYDGDEVWFEGDVTCFKLGGKKSVLGVDIVDIPSSEVTAGHLPKKVKMVVTDEGVDADLLFNSGYERMTDGDSQIWVRRR